MTFLCDNPWIVHRDEMDLLEEEVDDLFRRHGRPAGDLVAEMETRVLREQTNTEELSAAEFDLQIGEESVVFEADTSDHLLQEPKTIQQSLRLQAMRDPVYVQVFQWSRRVYAYTTQRYQVEGDKKEELFRVHVNVNLVPLKCAAALLEQMGQDSLSQTMFEKERRLCEIYFLRTLDSLRHCAFTGDEEADVLEKEGRAIYELVHAQFV